MASRDGGEWVGALEATESYRHCFRRRWTIPRKPYRPADGVSLPRQGRTRHTSITRPRTWSLSPPPPIRSRTPCLYITRHLESPDKTIGPATALHQIFLHDQSERARRRSRIQSFRVCAWLRLHERNRREETIDDIQRTPLLWRPRATFVSSRHVRGASERITTNLERTTISSEGHLGKSGLPRRASCGSPLTSAVNRSRVRFYPSAE
jgi:hypothetical protein